MMCMDPREGGTRESYLGALIIFIGCRKNKSKKQLFQYTTKFGQNIIEQQGIHKDALGSKWREEGLGDTWM